MEADLRTLYPGHRYELDHLDGTGKTVLQFVQRKPHHETREGVTNQEVVRALIDRVSVLDSEVKWEGNRLIIHHLRMVIALHEMRALMRHVEKHDFPIERAVLGLDGHISTPLHGEQS